MPKVIDYSVNGQCSRCCHCCGPLIPLTMTEANRMKKLYKTNKEVKEIVDKNCSVVLKNGKPRINLCCPFADLENHRCSIYEDRPEICKRFRCNRDNEADVKDCEQKAHYNHISYYKDKKNGDGASNFMTTFKLLGKGLMHNIYIFFHMRSEIGRAYEASVKHKNDKIMLETLNEIDSRMHFDKSTYNKALELMNQCFDASDEEEEN